MFQIFIQGYGNDDVEDLAGFDEVGDDVISLFVGYTEGEIKIGDTIRIGDPDPIDVTVVEASLGFGGNVYSVPVGYKSVLLVRGDAGDINVLKTVMEQVTMWNESEEDISAAVISQTLQ